MTAEPPNVITLLTPPGVSALAVIRLTGRAVPEFFARRFDKPARPGRCIHGTLCNDDDVIDDPVVVLLDDHTADLSLHGGTAVVAAVLTLARGDGFVDPLPSIPTDLPSEIETALPSARTETAVRALLAQPNAWQFLDPATVLADESGRWLTRPPTVAVVGPANVGKSTLANRLFGQDRSIVADRPGTTRDWVGAVADLGGLAVTLVDTPGARDTSDPIERAAVAASAAQVAAADLVVVVVDASVPPTADAGLILARFADPIVVANKSDRPAAWSIPGAIAVSAATGQGVDRLSAAVRRRFGWEPTDPSRPRWWTERQRNFLMSLRGTVHA